MSIPLKTYNFYLSTRERDEGTDINNATWTLNEPLSLNGEIPSSFQVTIKHATIPFSFLQWNTVTNTSYWEVSRLSNIYTGTYIIDESNYNALNFKDEFITKVTASIAAVVPGYTPSITGTYNQYSNKYTFSLASDVNPTTITFGHYSEYDYIDIGLGFTDAWSLTSGGSTISDGMVNVNPSRNLYIWSNNLFARNYEALTSQVDNSTNMCVIPIYTLPNSYIVYDPPNPTVNDLTNGVITSINLQLKSENIPLNLQQMKLNWSVAVMIQEVTTNFILESHRQQQVEYRERAQAVLTQQLELTSQKDEVQKKIEALKLKESKKISKLLQRQHDRLLKEQQKEENKRIDEYKSTLNEIK